VSRRRDLPRDRFNAVAFMLGISMSGAAALLWAVVRLRRTACAALALQLGASVILSGGAALLRSS